MTEPSEHERPAIAPSSRRAPAPLRRRFISPEYHTMDLEKASPRQILEWAATTVDRLAVASSFQSSGLVILHQLREIRPDVPVLFLDTGFHFQETLEFKERIAEMWDLDVVDLRGRHRSPKQQSVMYGPGLYRTDPDKCCAINKVEPLQRALENFEGWISGVRRDQSKVRAQIPIVDSQLLPSGNEITKIHPLARWNKVDVMSYVERHDIPTHPLLEKGYPSIGCWPCTRPIQIGEDERAGRWDGAEKDECGIHTFGKVPVDTDAEQ